VSLGSLLATGGSVDAGVVTIAELWPTSVPVTASEPEAPPAATPAASGIGAPQPSGLAAAAAVCSAGGVAETAVVTGAGGAPAVDTPAGVPAGPFAAGASPPLACAGAEFCSSGAVIGGEGEEESDDAGPDVAESDGGGMEGLVSAAAGAGSALASAPATVVMEGTGASEARASGGIAKRRPAATMTTPRHA